MGDFDNIQIPADMYESYLETLQGKSLEEMVEMICKYEIVLQRETDDTFDAIWAFMKMKDFIEMLIEKYPEIFLKEAVALCKIIPKMEQDEIKFNKIAEKSIRKKKRKELKL